MNHPFRYLGFFVAHDEFYHLVDGIRQAPLPQEIVHPHVTYLYLPRSADRSLFGEPVRIRCIGYGNDGRNEGVSVRLRAERPEVQRMIDRILLPHITIAVSPGFEPFDTRFLHFTPIEPVELTGVFGGYIEGGTVITAPPEGSEEEDG